MSLTVFHLMCVSLTTVIVCNCIYIYVLDESTSLVNFQTFGKRPALDIYPTISLCLCQLGFINEAKLKADNVANYSKEYKNFLFGDVWNAEMATIDYDQYTLNLTRYVNQTLYPVNRKL